MNYMSVLRNAVALRPVRIKPKMNQTILYTAIGFVTDTPDRAIDQYLRMMGTDELQREHTSADYFILDIFDAEGDIIQDYPVTRRGFNYLRRKLKFIVDERSREDV